MNKLSKETAIHNNQQSKTKQEIINDIIKILADNNLTVTDSKDILYETSKAIGRQVVTLPITSRVWINANDFINK